MNRHEIRLSKDVVRKKIEEMLIKDPNIGAKDFIVKLLEAKGINCADKNPKETRQILKTLSPSTQKEIKIALDTFLSIQEKTIKDFKKGVSNPFRRLTGNVVSTLVKGGAIGTSVAAVINSVAPGLVSTGLGYLAGAGQLAPLVKLGLVSVGAFSPPAITQGALLGVGAVVGAAIYGTGKMFVKAGKSIGEAVKRSKSSKKASGHDNPDDSAPAL